MKLSEQIAKSIVEPITENWAMPDEQGKTSAIAQSAQVIAERTHCDDPTTEINRLREAIIRHRSQKADDRCILDDDELYAVLGDGIKCDRRVGDKTAMLVNCAKFIDNRCEAGGWKTYAELEKENQEMRWKASLMDSLIECVYAFEPHGDEVPDRKVIEALLDKIMECRELKAQLKIVSGSTVAHHRSDAPTE